MGDEYLESPLTFDYTQYVQNCTILNDGQMIQIKVDCMNKCNIRMNDKAYCLKEIHFHTPSEHTIDSKQHQMEMQMIHTNEQNEFAVLTFLFSATQNNVPLTQQNIDMAAEEEETDDEDAEVVADEATISNINNLVGNAFLNQFWTQ